MARWTHKITYSRKVMNIEKLAYCLTSLLAINAAAIATKMTEK